MKSIIKDESGFTTIELITAMQLLVLIVATAGGMYLFYQKMHVKYTKKTMLEQAVRTDLADIERRVRTARSIMKGSADKLTLEDRTGKIYAYRRSAGRLVRNDHQLTRDGISLENWHLNYESAGSTLDKDLDGKAVFSELDADGDNILTAGEAARVNEITVTLCYRQKNDTLSVTRRIAPRSLREAI